MRALPLLRFAFAALLLLGCEKETPKPQAEPPPPEPPASAAEAKPVEQVPTTPPPPPAPTAIPAVTADAGSVAAKSRPGPARLTTRYCKDGTRPNPRLPGLPKTAVEFVGNGNNYVYVDQENDLVIVVRWISGSGGEFYNKVVGSLQQR